MKTLKTVEVTPVFFEGSAPAWKDMEQNVIYISYEYELALHLCLCGCKEKTVMPFDKKYGWKLIVNGG